MSAQRRQHPEARALVVCACAIVLSACQSAPKPKPPTCRPNDLSGCIIEEVEILGNDAIPDAAIKERIATAESAHALGGVLQNIPVVGLSDLLTVEYEYFDPFVLERDLARVERYLRARGFYEARVTAGRVVRRPSDGRVRVEISVSEGAPVKIRRVNLMWKDWRMPEAAEVSKPVTEAKNELVIGARMEEEAYEKTKKALARAMTDRGFPYANVVGQVKVDLVAHTADVTYTLELGPRSKFGAIRIVGLGELPEGIIRKSLGFKEGDLFSTETLVDAERALGDFGIFGAIDIKPELSPPDKPPDPTIPVTITLQPSALRAVKLGVGAEAGARVEVHGSASWEDRNFLGGLRRFAIEARPGVVFYPSALFNLFLAAPTQVLPEIRSRFELRQPGVIDAHTQAVLRGAVNIYRPLNIISTPAPDSEEAKEPALGYREYSGTVGIERRFGGFQHYLGQFFHVQVDDPFLYWSDEHPPGFSRLLLMYLETSGNLDFRRDDRGNIDRVSPRKGVFLGLNAQLAGVFMKSDVDDVRLRPDLRAYLPIAPRVTLAFHLSGGFLIPQQNIYEETLGILEQKAKERVGVDEDGDGMVDGTNLKLDELRATLQKLQFRGFYSGGPTSNRGYIYNGVGLHSNVPLRRTGVAPWSPTGGLTLWEATLELRLSFTENLGAVLFLDGSDVTSGVLDIRVDRPHLSGGIGVRYATPVGPVRVDVGARIPCAQVIGECDEVQIAYDAGRFGYTGGFPLVTTIAIGEAF
ncbi:MAG: BamA/TamA family outer membrane protein [Polyangiaceae bacterium]|nr:BamA/TamA family outer membrane protein [Polyangiaceae bacterium]